MSVSPGASKMRQRAEIQRSLAQIQRSLAHRLSNNIWNRDLLRSKALGHTHLPSPAHARARRWRLRKNAARRNRARIKLILDIQVESIVQRRFTGLRDGQPRKIRNRHLSSMQRNPQRQPREQHKHREHQQRTREHAQDLKKSPHRSQHTGLDAAQRHLRLSEAGSG